MLLQFMSLAGDVARHFELIGEADTGHLAERGVWLLRRRGIDARTDPPLLRVGLHGRYFVPLHRLAARLADQLLYRRHSLPLRSIHRQNSPHHLEPNRGLPHKLSAPQHRGPWRASLQDHDPDMIPVNPAASNPRSKATRQGLPPAAKVRVVSGRFLHRQETRSQKLEARSQKQGPFDFWLLASGFWFPVKRWRPPPPDPPARSAPKPCAPALQVSARRGGLRSCSACSTCRRCRPESADRRSRSL